MNFFSSRKRKARPAAPVRLSDPIAQAMQTGDRRAGDVIWFGGISFRMEGQR
jgi:hypothetical protein